MARKNHPKGRTQARKFHGSLSGGFEVFRGVTEESADEIYELMLGLKRDNVLPPQTEVEPADNLRVTYFRRRRMSKELRGYSLGFVTREGVRKLNDREGSGRRYEEITVGLGRTGLANRRDNNLVSKLEHNQVIADEFSMIASALAQLHVTIRPDQFSPDLLLAHIPGLEFDEKTRIEKEVNEVLPVEIELLPLDIIPPR